MAGKKGKRTKDSVPRPKPLQKRLRKAESRLAKAIVKRDRAQARVDAMSIIADEIRAQVAEIQRPEEAAAAGTSGTASTPRTRRIPARRTQPPVDGTTDATTGSPAADDAASGTPPRARRSTGRRTSQP